jgi:hypothetical protein
LIERDFKLMSSRLNAMGIHLDNKIRGNFDLKWQAPKKEGDFPLPVLIENHFEIGEYAQLVTQEQKEKVDRAMDANSELAKTQVPELDHAMTANVFVDPRLAFSPSDHIFLNKIHRLEIVGKNGEKMAKNTGGIDLTPAHMNLETEMDSRLPRQGGGFRGNDNGIKFHLDPAMLARLQNALGFVPVIVSVEPLMNLRKFLGAEEIASRSLPPNV